MRGLGTGEKGYEKYRKIFRKSFIFLNEYTTSVQAEHDPRGPEGPYQFKDRSVPVLVFKRWNGETIVQQLGFNPQPEQAKRALAQIVDRVLKKHGPVVAPKALRPLLKGWKKAQEHLGKKRTNPAIRELLKIDKAGANTKKFPEPPEVVEQAREALKKLESDANQALIAAEALASTDPDAAKKALRKVDRDYGALKTVKDKVKVALKKLADSG